MGYGHFFRWNYSCFLRERLFDLGEGVQPSKNRVQMHGITEDDEDGIVAAQGAHDFGPLLPVQGLGDRLSAAGKRPHDNEVARSLGAYVESWEQPRDRRPLVPAFRR